MIEVKQITMPANPIENILATADAIVGAGYAGLAADPILGPVASVLPAPPKLSGTVGQITRQIQLPALPRLPNAPPFPGVTTGQENIPAHRAPPAYSPFG